MPVALSFDPYFLALFYAMISSLTVYIRGAMIAKKRWFKKLITIGNNMIVPINGLR